MPTLRVNDPGPLAQLWNRFLREKGFLSEADWWTSPGVFTEASKQATQAFQVMLADAAKRNNSSVRIAVDGIPGNQTFGYACAITDQDWLNPQAIAAAMDVDYPKRDSSLPDAGEKLQVALFGEIVADPAPEKGKDAIRIVNGFDKEWIAPFEVPELATITGSKAATTQLMHKKAARQIQAVFSAWAALGLLARITTFDGLWVPRYKRGLAPELSNHAWGTAFDINASANWLGHLPAFPGENGSLLPLVPVAQDFCMGWGGLYRRRLDGMHFEVLKLMSIEEINAARTKYGLSNTLP
ncbi:M15 family metallopeptidase [Variovorax sp. R-27]|uniref:M15 family metallopeptidase n=1 Tax=Variovorax sp. R-27 TaxID=3404058 RepID=UPI003CF6113A